MQKQQSLEQHFYTFLSSFFHLSAYDVQNFLKAALLKKIISLSILLLLFGYLLFFPVSALEASKNGLLLWFDTLLPTLLPFLILSQLILKTSAIQIFQKTFGNIFKNVFHCSTDGAFCALCGFLCGYPVGARLLALQVKEHRISPSEGQYLLAFCNNVSPMFCISYGIITTIGAEKILPYLLLIYGSPFVFGLLTRPKTNPDSVFNVKKQTPSVENIFQLIDVCIIDSFLIMIKLCGYLILFSILNQIILYLPMKKSGNFYGFISSVLELTNGLASIQTLPLGVKRTALAIFALSFGGLCCIFQTTSVLNESGLSIKKYILHKCLITGITLFFYFLWHFFYHAFNGWS